MVLYGANEICQHHGAHDVVHTDAVGVGLKYEILKMQCAKTVSRELICAEHESEIGF